MENGNFSAYVTHYVTRYVTQTVVGEYYLKSNSLIVVHTLLDLGVTNSNNSSLIVLICYQLNSVTAMDIIHFREWTIAVASYPCTLGYDVHKMLTEHNKL